MGTRGAFGVIIGEKEKIGYNQFDSYPSERGLANLRWLRDVDRDELRTLAENARVIDESAKPTPDDIRALAPHTNLNVSDQSTEDWYCLTRDTHGDIGAMLRCGYIEDASAFPLESLFCEWAYIVDLDKNVFEVYTGFQTKLPKRGRWKGRPTKAEDAANFREHLYWCYKNDRKPYLTERSEYKAVELVASWPLDALPDDDEFIAQTDPVEGGDSPEVAVTEVAIAAQVVGAINGTRSTTVEPKG